jgi:hypothetical protein
MADGSEDEELGAGKHRAALISGTFALIGALIGGTITGTVSYVTASKQIDGSSHQASAQFYRQQKQAAYAQILKDMSAASDPIVAAIDGFWPAGNIHDDGLQQKREASYATARSLKDDYNVIRLIGSKDAIDRANECWGAVSAPILQTDAVAIKTPPDGRITPEQFSELSSIWKNNRSKVSDAQDAFANAARADLDKTQ